jgi:hypothetical protein
MPVENSWGLPTPLQPGLCNRYLTMPIYSIAISLQVFSGFTRTGTVQQAAAGKPSAGLLRRDVYAPGGSRSSGQAS